MDNVFGYKRRPPSWDPSQVRNVRVHTRRQSGLTQLTDPSPVEHVGIDVIRFEQNYVAVIMPSGHAFIYPYATLVYIECLPTLDTSDAARAEAVAQFKRMQIGGANAESHVSAAAGAPES